MDSSVQIGNRKFERQFLTDRASTEGQIILARAREQRTPIFCLCTGQPLPLFVRKAASGYTLVRAPGHGAEHHADCLSGKDYSQSGGNHSGASPLASISRRIRMSLLDSSDLDYLLRLLWVESGYCEWHAGFASKRNYMTFNYRLKQAAARISLGDITLADILLLIGEDGHLVESAKAIVGKYGVMPILVGRYKGLGSRVHDTPILFYGGHDSVWISDFYIVRKMAGYSLSVADDSDVRVYGIFQPKVTKGDYLKTSFGSLVAADGDELIPIICEAHRVLVDKLIQERRHFKIVLENDGQFNIELLDTNPDGQTLYIAPMYKPATIGAWYWDCRKHSMPPALPTSSRQGNFHHRKGT